MSAPFEIAHLDSIPALAAPDAPAWKPVRQTLGIDGFGVDAYAGERAGDTVIADHAEPVGAAGRQALYVVVAGAARFRVDGEELDAPAGTLLFVRDPTVRRRAEALTAGTTVLAVSSAAEAPARDPLADHPEAARLHYNLACYAALADRVDEAIEHLRRAVDLDPAAAAWARDDADLAGIRGFPGFPGPV